MCKLPQHSSIGITKTFATDKNMLIGQKGVKYGLTVPTKDKTKRQASVKQPLAVFADDDDEELDVGAQVARQAAKKRTDGKVARLHEEALTADASIFDYDGVYDEMSQQRVQPKQQEKLARKSRYIESLLDKAKDRQREQDIVYERRLAKEREVEDHLFGDKDKFVTAAYKRKLEEDRKWLEAEKLREEAEAKRDVVKKGHMGDFYRNLLSGNVAFGAEQKPKREGGGAQRQGGLVEASSSPAQPVTAPGAVPQDSQAAADPAWEVDRKAREAFETRQAGQAERDVSSLQSPGPGETAAKGRTEADEGMPAAHAGAPDGTVQPLEHAGKAGLKADAAAAARETDTADTTDKESKAAAARERYLARKRKAGQ